MSSWITALLGYQPEKEVLHPNEFRRERRVKQNDVNSDLPENVSVNEVTDKLEVHTQTEDGNDEWSDFDPNTDRKPRGSLELTEEEKVFFETTHGFSLDTAMLMKPKWAKWKGPKVSSQELLKKNPDKRGLSYESCRRYWKIFNRINSSPTGGDSSQS